MIAHPWQEYKITLTAKQDYSNPYREVDVEVVFAHESGYILRRPAFEDGGRI